MKKYSTILLASSLLLGSPVSAFADESSITSSSSQSTGSSHQEPSSSSEQETRLTQPATETALAATPLLTLSQVGQNLSISYQRTPEQTHSSIQFAIWSDENGQDDMKWYTATGNQTTIDTHSFTDGSYQLHAYVFVENKPVFLSQATFSISARQPSVVATVSEPGTVSVVATSLPSQTAKVQVPIWSEENGQDDIVWYDAIRQADGTYNVRVDLKRHNLALGNYHIHLYAKDSNGKQIQFANTSISITPQDLPTPKKPVIAIENLQTTAGRYQVSITPSPTEKAIQSIQVATWSAANKSNIKWRTPSLQNGKYISQIDFQEHNYLTEIYHNHVYITYADGSKVGYVANTVDLTSARLPLKFESSVEQTGMLTAKLSNVYDDKPVRFAVWSAENGQDDIKWYPASKIADKTYKADIPLHQHQGIGQYHIHAYQDKGLGAFSTTIHASQKTSKTPNTYPVGECTWGAKELAPWIGNYWGNASSWLSSARAAGFRTGTTPKVGAVAVWTSSFYGHVAVVTEVASPTRIRLKESNYAGNRYIGDFRGWFNPVADGVAGYIYPN